MAKLDSKQKELAYRVLAGILTCGSLFCAAMMLGKVGKMDVQIDLVKVGTYLGIAMLQLGVYELLTYSFYRRKERKWAWFHLVYACVYVVSGVLAFCAKVLPILMPIAGCVYLLIPLVKRVAAIMRNHSKRNVVLHVLIGVVNLIVLALSLIAFLMQDVRDLISVSTVGMSLLVICLFNVAGLSFSNFNLDLMRKIVRKTYAGEILFGLLLLIIAFSVTISTMEPNINTFADALWYCFAIVTTIGFGDITATTLIGRLLSVFLGIYGIVVVAIITSIIVNFYNEVKSTPDEENKPKQEEPSVKEEPQSPAKAPAELSSPKSTPKPRKSK